MQDPIKPDLDGACVTRLVAALLARDLPAWMPAPVADARSVVLLVLDGLGWLELQRHRALMPELASMAGGPIVTVLPSSTASALTSITTGAPPSGHGVTGMVTRTEGMLVHVLRWTTPADRSPPVPQRVQPLPPFGGRAVPVVTRASFAGTGFTNVHLRGTRLHGWRTTSMLIEQCRELAEQAEPFVYAYYDGVDLVAHAAGLEHGVYRRELAATDRLVGELLDALPPAVALVVTADHGQVAVHDDDWILLEQLGSLVHAHAGDARCRYLYARSGAGSELLEAATRAAGDRAWVLGRDRFVEEGWLGPASDLARERVGDVVLLARGRAAFIDPAHRPEVYLRSVHGSATPEEMLVPLLAARGRHPG